MKSATSPLAPLFRSDTQGRILAALLASPHREFTVAELTQIGDTSQPTAWRECQRAETAGLVASRAVGRTLLFKANEHHPLFTSFRQILISTFGPPAVIAPEYRDIAGVEAVILFGSWVERFKGKTNRNPADIDVLVLGKPNRDALYEAEMRAEKALSIPMQTTIRAVSAWLNPDPFLTDVHKKDYMVLYVADDNANLASLRDQLGE
ncbi:MAG: hypothetical protein RL441_1389 [Actinomycetota bacterium]